MLWAAVAEAIVELRYQNVSAYGRLLIVKYCTSFPDFQEKKVINAAKTAIA